MDDRSSLDDACANGAAQSHVDEKQRDWNDFINRSARSLARGTRDRAVEADDIAQVARLKLFRVKPEGQSRNWVGKVLFNEMRREAGRPATPPSLDDAAFNAPDITVPTEGEILMRMSVRRWLAGLRPDLQDVYRLLYVENLTQRTTAKKLGRSQSRVNQLHQELVALGRQKFVH